MKHVILFAALGLGLALAGCHSGNNLNTTPDLSMPTQPDLSMKLVDMKQLSCAEILSCATASPQKFSTCVGEGTPAAQGLAAELGICAAQNCLTDGGSGGGVGILQCLSTYCQSQLNACLSG